jgi:ankyrin repeat protein
MNIRLTKLNVFVVTQLFSSGVKKLQTGKERHGNDVAEEPDKIPIKDSPFNYAVSYWLKHAMEVPHGIRATSLSKELWGVVRDFFWDGDGTVYTEWLRVFPANFEEWHWKPKPHDEQIGRCLMYPDVQKTVTCLNVAASYGLVDILEWAHPDGIDFNERNRLGKTPLMYAAWIGEEIAINLILSRNGVEVNRTGCLSPITSGNCDGGCGGSVNSALISAVSGHRHEVTKMLLAHPNIDVDLVVHGYTALGIAIEGRNPKGIQMLVSAGAKLAMCDGEIKEIPTGS